MSSGVLPVAIISAIIFLPNSMPSAEDGPVSGSMLPRPPNMLSAPEPPSRLDQLRAQLAELVGAAYRDARRQVAQPRLDIDHLGGLVLGGGAVPADPADYSGWDFQHFFLQPMDGPDRDACTAAAIDYCLAHPQWRLSIQTHKLLGIP